jgi:hypothetical protein
MGVRLVLDCEPDADAGADRDQASGQVGTASPTPTRRRHSVAPSPHALLACSHSCAAAVPVAPGDLDSKIYRHLRSDRQHDGELIASVTAPGEPRPLLRRVEAVAAGLVRLVSLVLEAAITAS